MSIAQQSVTQITLPAMRTRVARDPSLRDAYIQTALADVPRLLGMIDRNPFRPTYGSLDKEYWHFRTSDFPSGMYQEGALPLALLFARPFPGNRWHQQPRVRELSVAALNFAANSSHRDGSCDDYYPFERALGAAVFSLAAATEAYRLLELNDTRLRDWFARRARWLAAHDESGRLSNHHALASLGLARAAAILDDEQLARAAESRVARVLGWQSREGWFDEYGGADPGYQTVTIDALAKYQRLTGAAWLHEPLSGAVNFARLFLHPDNSYAGEYGSRGTAHFYPHGMELLAAANHQAAELADGFLRSLATGKAASFGDDRMFLHRLGNLIEAWHDWTPETSVPRVQPPRPQQPEVISLPDAGLWVCRRKDQQTVVAARRGAVFKHFAGNDRPAVTDAGIVLETADGRVAVSQLHTWRESDSVSVPANRTRVGPFAKVMVRGNLHWTKFELATPGRLILFRTGLLAAGRWFRTLVRRLLQKRLITGRRSAPISHTRRLEWSLRPCDDPTEWPYQLRVIDRIELVDPRLTVRRMSLASDGEAAYVAASAVYQPSALQPWTDLAAYVDELNQQRSVTVIREL